MLTPDAGSITSRLEIGMSYSNYDREIRAELGVQLVGWPEGIQFATPSALGAKVRTLHKALVNGECKWAKMGKSEVEELKRKLPPKAPRATRSDKGGSRSTGKRSCRDVEGEPEDAEHDGHIARASEGKGKRRPKRARKEKDTPAFKSAEFIEEDEEGEGDDEDDENDE